jgi:hypothetical protein
MKTRSRMFAAMLAGMGSINAQADILVGGFGADSTAAGSTLRFANDANGNAAPIGNFYTDLAGDRMNTPTFLTYEPIEDVVYVSDFYGQMIRVYKQNADGNVAPLRTLKAPILGQPRQTVVDTDHDELISIVSNCCLAVFPRTASGNMTSPSRFVQWGGLTSSVTRLDNPVSLARRESTDELIVADYDAATSGGLIVFFDRLASGNAAPTRTIEGASTKLGRAAISVAYDDVHDELFVAALEQDTFRIVTFPGTASGNLAPSRTIEGINTTLNGTTSIAYDAAHDLIYVTQGYNTYPVNVLAFPRTSSGNVSPLRTITSTSLSTQPHGIAFVPSGRIFASSFE